VFILAPTAHVATYAETLQESYERMEKAKAYERMEKEININIMKEEVRINPDDASAHNNLGLAYSILGKYEEAIKSYKQAIRIDPDDARAHNHLGVA